MQILACLDSRGVGLSAIIAAKTFSPKNLVALDIEDTKLSLALKLGATAAVKASDQGVIEKVRAITDGNMFDYLVEAAGKTQTIEQGFSLIHPHRGELIFASHPEHGKKNKS